MLCCLISRWKCILTNHQSGLTFTKTTTANVRRVIDTEGWHATFAFETKYEVKRFAHTTGHGYTNGKDNFTLRKATLDLEKSDYTPRGCLGPNKVVWPSKEFIEEFENSMVNHFHSPRKTQDDEENVSVEESIDQVLQGAVQLGS